MELTLEQIKSITQGALRVWEQDGGVALSRFTEAEDALYAQSTFFIRRFASAGIQLEFKTDATALTLKVLTSEGSSRTYFSYDIFRDDEMIGTLRNYDDSARNTSYTTAPFPLGTYAGTFALGEGMKTVRIVLPWSVATVIQALDLENITCLIPVCPDKTVLMYGDSITQGYDSLNPSRAYAVQLGRFLKAEAFNKGIGGERFNPALAAIKNDLSPNYITVAYGTNDIAYGTSAWNVEKFENACRSFYHTLHNHYPDAKMIGISPIWRKDAEEDVIRNALEQVSGIIETVCKEVNAAFIHGWELVPQDEAFFGDERLHPNNEGFDCYFENLAKQL